MDPEALLLDYLDIKRRNQNQQPRAIGLSRLIDNALKQEALYLAMADLAIKRGAAVGKPQQSGVPIGPKRRGSPLCVLRTEPEVLPSLLVRPATLERPPPKRSPSQGRSGLRKRKALLPMGGSGTAAGDCKVGR